MAVRTRHIPVFAIRDFNGTVLIFPRSKKPPVHIAVTKERNWRTNRKQVSRELSNYDYDTGVTSREFRTLTGVSLKPGEMAKVDLIANPRSVDVDKTLYGIESSGSILLFTKPPKIEEQERTVRFTDDGAYHPDGVTIKVPVAKAQEKASFCTTGFTEGTGLEVPKNTTDLKFGIRVKSVKKLREVVTDLE